MNRKTARKNEKNLGHFFIKKKLHALKKCRLFFTPVPKNEDLVNRYFFFLLIDSLK